MAVTSNEPILFDRVSHKCPACGTDTTITAAYLSLTRVGLETTCPMCERQTVKMFDLLKIHEILIANDTRDRQWPST